MTKENLLGKRDQFKKFMRVHSLAYKNTLISRPIIAEKNKSEEKSKSGTTRGRQKKGIVFKFSI